MLDDEIAVHEGKTEIRALAAPQKEARPETADEPTALPHAGIAEFYALAGDDAGRGLEALR